MEYVQETIVTILHNQEIQQSLTPEESVEVNESSKGKNQVDTESKNDENNDLNSIDIDSGLRDNSKKCKMKTREEFEDAEVQQMMPQYYGAELDKIKNGRGMISTPCLSCRAKEVFFSYTRLSLL